MLACARALFLLSIHIIYFEFTYDYVFNIIMFKWYNILLDQSDVDSLFFSFHETCATRLYNFQYEYEMLPKL